MALSSLTGEIDTLDHQLARGRREIHHADQRSAFDLGARAVGSLSAGGAKPL